ncbi:hypothetical protein [Mucilaginibacter gotjawali]|uniref:Fibronectin type-III domain-containing protein n=1 Tax=Mucilaginibacter gotjawali TaxID=1550579 RepID=A0A839SLG1_9SPHI|nr:hypothetical protein [Mucilaginibacter gotjawali]MBB3058143.1 hypothetical protein [Mucilaginibacter gotjawali]
MILIASIAILSSCTEIIEPSLSKQQIQLEAPVDQYQSTSYTINFWWDAVDHALSYHLQVVSPTFVAPGGLILDTMVHNYRFSYTLNPGNYQWRVMAENGSSQTAWSSPKSFTVVAGSIKQQSVQLTSPANNLVTNQSSYTFQWGSLYGATAYQLEIDTNNFANESAIVSNQTISGQQLSFIFPKDQTYQWRVRAQNDTAQALWSTVFLVTYDHTPPGQVTLVAPVTGTTLSLPVALSWNAVATAVKYKLYVYKSDGTTIYNSSFPMSLTSTSYSFNLGSSGNTVYWMVTALDAAGNESPASTKNSFVVQ